MGGRSSWTGTRPSGTSPGSRAGGLHLYYLSRVQYGNGNWRMGRTGGQIRSRNGFVMIWDPFALADMLAHRSMMVVSPEDLPFPAIALGAKSQAPRDYGMRTPPPRREGQARRLPRPPSLESAAAPARAPGPPPSRGAGRPATSGVGAAGPAGPPEVGAGAQPPPGSPRARNCELFDSIRFFAYPLPRGRGGPSDIRPVEEFPPEVRPSLQRPVCGAPLRRRRGEDGPQRRQVHLAEPVRRPVG